MGEQRAYQKVIGEDRAQILRLVAEGEASGLTQAVSCEAVCVGQRTLPRWRQMPVLEDGRKGPRTAPCNRLTEYERLRVVEIATSREFINKSPHQIVPQLADRGEFLASESSFYRILKHNEILAHRGRAKPRKIGRPKALQAKKPNELYSWDITYLRSSVRGQYFYLYIFLDVFSRKIVGWRVHDRESSELSSALLTEICLTEKVAREELSVHADNGGPMKGATMLVTMQKLGIVPSFSRPSVSDDNPFSESLFKTLKYCPQYPNKPFASIDDATAWVASFVTWYNTEHLHSGIKFVTPTSRHDGRDSEILNQRKLVYNEAKLKNPSRWSKQTRNWERIATVKLNCLKEEDSSTMTAISRSVS